MRVDVADLSPSRRRCSRCSLLLGFSLNMADQRFEARRASMMDDTITLLSLNIRADFLPEPRRTAFKRLLHDYIAAHLEVSSPKTTESEEQFIARADAEALHKSMCDEVRKEVTGEHPSKGAAEMVAPLVDALAIHRRWVTAMETKVPQSILIPWSPLRWRPRASSDIRAACPRTAASCKACCSRCSSVASSLSSTIWTRL